MKKRLIMVAVLVLTLTFSFMETTLADGTLRQWTANDCQYVRVVRPSIRLMSGKGEGRLLMQLDFGEQLQLLMQDGDYCLVRETTMGVTGYVATQYLVQNASLIWIGSKGVSLSPKPGMTFWDFGYAAGGMRMNEEALVLFEDNGGYYYYVVTAEGYSGYVYKYDPEITFVISR